MRWKDWARGALVLAGLCAGHGAMAQTTIYKCTDASGAMTVRNAPCPAGSKEDRSVVGEVASRPPPAAPGDRATPTAVQQTRLLENAPTLPPPSRPPPPLHLSAKPDPATTPPAPTGPATVIYRCTDASGALAIQNTPCPAGSRTDKRAVQGVASMPLPGNRPADTPPPPVPTAAPASAQVPPPPAAASVQRLPPAVSTTPAASLPSARASSPTVETTPDARVPAPAPTSPQTTIYRCTDAQGSQTFQNSPCPAGSKADRRAVQSVTSMPLPASRTAPASTRTPAAALPQASRPAAPPRPGTKTDTAVAPAAPTGPQTTIYRCTDARGAQTFQNSPCPAGSISDKRAMQSVTSMPLPASRPAPAAAQPASTPAARGAAANAGDTARSPAIAPARDAGQAPPATPGMTLIQDPSLHKDDAAADALAGRKPAQANDAPAGSVTGSAPPILFQCTTYDSGSYLTEDAEPKSRCAPLKTVGLDGNPAGGAGRACEVIHDVCARVPDQRLCAAWKKRLGETEVAWRYAKPENEAGNKAEYDRVQRIVNDAHCQ